MSARGAFRTGVHTPQPHDSAAGHVRGSATFVDDLPEPPGLLHAALVLSPVAHGTLRAIDATRAAALPGVVAVLTAADIPGRNDVAPVIPGEVLLAAGLVEYAGQPVAVVVATSLDVARAAAAAVTLDIAPLEPVLTVEDALARRAFLVPSMVIARGDVARGLAAAPQRLSGELRMGGQEHFYLEGQIALATPGEDGGLVIQSSTQHPTEVQQLSAGVLGLDFNRVTVQVRRLGGGFGGKESNATAIAAAAALAAWKTRRPVKLRLPRETDMIATGKRHPFLVRWQAGFDATGRILALDAELAANGGHSTDHTPPALLRAISHVDNAYAIPDFRATGHACKTNTVSNTAFRGFGGPQGVLVMEDVIERVARTLGLAPDAVRARNYYGPATHEVTPYGQPIRDNLIERCVEQVRRDADWEARRAAIDAFNRTSPVIRRGLGLFPLKFGISFTKAALNQAGALVHVYADGSIRLNHGGTEMGQGLFVKIAQVVAEVFQVDLDRVALSATSTGEVPNTAPTAASTGSDLNGWAAYNAADAIKRRMTAFAAAEFGVAEAEVLFRDNQVQIGPAGSNRVLAFDALAKRCWQARVSLSAAGHYKTPGVFWDPQTLTGEPFFYFSYGAAVAEVAVDTLTGESRVLRADLVQDCGDSLNPAIDLGQIEGGFVQGQGWLTCEELWWDADGRLRTVGPSTYKIPGSRDVPPVFNVRILENAPARAATIFRSKGIGEPPLMLATAVWTALKDAIGSLAEHRIAVTLDPPATPERVLDAVTRLRAQAG